jgi:hypothetical protein
MTTTALSAIDEYERTYIKGWWHRLWSVIRRKPHQLIDLRAITTGNTVRAQHAGGVQTVRIKQILGSEGRADEFDDAFHPSQPHTEQRWRGIAQAWLDGANLPPVELIRIGETYYVRDGHHRISVAKALGQREIDAIVTVWQIDEAVGACDTSVEVPAHQPPVVCHSTLARA